MNNKKEPDQNILTEFTYKKIFSDYYLRLCSYAQSYVGDMSIAEDLVQDVFVNLWNKKDRIQIETSTQAYLYRTVHNACIHFLRHKKVSEKHIEYHKIKLQEAELLYFSNLETTSGEIQAAELENKIREVVDALPEKTRETFLLSREEDLKNQEIANRLNLTVKAVEYHISKALSGLRNALNEYL